MPGEIAWPSSANGKATLAEIQAAMVGFPRLLRWDDFAMWDDADAERAGAEAQVSTNVKVKSWGLSLGGKFGNFIDNVKVVVTLDSLATRATKAARTARTAPRLLNHEQGHFDIQALLARDVATKLLNFHIESKTISGILQNKSATNEDKSSRLHRIIEGQIDIAKKKMNKLVSVLQDDELGQEGIYDKDTEHGRNEDEQRNWDILIRYVKMTNVMFEDELVRRGMLPKAL